MPISHHELCFGCGTANLFGLQMELEREAEGAVSGRFFVKQDHQGPPGLAHGGVIASALDEAMSLAIHGEGILAATAQLEVDLRLPVAIGEFVRVEGRIEGREGDRITAWAALRGSEDDRVLAEAHGVFVGSEAEGCSPFPGPRDA